MKKLEKYLLPSITFIIVIAAWQITSAANLFPRELFPSPLDVVKGVEELVTGGNLWPDIGVSLVRYFSGYVAAVLVAVPLGLFLGWYSKLWMAVDPLVQVLRPISPIAWFPLISLWFGIGNLPAIIIIFIAAFYPILLSTVTAVRNVDQSYLKVARNFGASKRNTIWKVVVPAIFPNITMGMHIALGSAWTFLVAGEMLGVRSGLGYLIIDSRNFLRTDLVFVGILLIGVLGLIIDRLISLIEKWVNTKWGVVSSKDGAI